MQCYTKKKSDKRFEHQSEYARDAFCRQCCSTYTLNISCKKPCWTLKAESKRRIAAFEMKFFRRILKMSYRVHITDMSVMQAITKTARPQEPLLATVKCRKLQWFGHTTRHNTLAKEILQGTVKGSRKQGRPQKMYLDNIRE